MMHSQSIILFLTALIIFSEAVALLIRTGVLIRPRPLWLTQKNFAFLADDAFFGIILMLVALGVITLPWIFWVSIISTFLSHTWRDAEFVARLPNPFCANLGLFIVNNVKLIGLLGSVLLR